MRKLIIITLLSSLIVGQAYAFGGGKGGGKKGGFGKILKQLDLTEEQEAKLKTLRKAKKEDRGKNKGEMKELHEKMKAAFINGKNDSEVQALHTQIKAMKMEKMDKRFQHMMDIRSVLTPDQRKKFFELQHSMRGHKKGKRKGKDKDKE